MIIRRRIHTAETVALMTKAQLGKALARNHADMGVVTHELCLAGYGHMRPTDIDQSVKCGDSTPLFLQSIALRAEYWVLSLEASCRYGGSYNGSRPAWRYVLDRWY